MFMLHYQQRPEVEDPPRLGLVIGKKFIRSAVKRNLVKRQARERFRHQQAALRGYDLVLRVIAKPERIAKPTAADEIDRLFAKLRPRRTMVDRKNGNPGQ